MTFPLDPITRITTTLTDPTALSINDRHSETISARTLAETRTNFKSSDPPDATA
jgi:hypothetical protein